MSVPVVADSRLELPQEDQEFIGDLAEELELDVEEIPIWFSELTHYQGRDQSNRPILGMKHDTPEARYSLAHELGHDFYNKFIRDEIRTAVPEIRDGELIYDHDDFVPDSIENIESEMIAELVAENHTCYNDIYDRNPFRSVESFLDLYKDISEHYSDHSEVISDLEDADLGEEEFEDLLKVLESYNPGRSYRGTPFDELYEHQIYLFSEIKDEPSDGIVDYHISLLRDLNGMAMEDFNMAKVIAKGWADDSNKDSTQIPLLGDISSLAEKNIALNYASHIWQAVKRPPSYIENNLDEYQTQIVNHSLDRIREEIPEANMHERYSQLPSPSHSAPAIYDGNVEELPTDFNHSIGCTLGRILSEHGVTHWDIVENEDEYRELARDATEEALRLGLYEDPEIEDFENSISYLIDEKQLT